MGRERALLSTGDALRIRLVFTVTLTVSAGLLFWIQPMFAKMVLPMLGGAPAVWNTAMVFFQASLLAGYAYAHFSTRHLDLRHQSLLHLGVMVCAFAALPIGVAAGWTPPTTTTPVGWLLALLAVSIGLPFFAVSATAPLLQKWFAHTRHEDSANPYFLYAASNVGSIVALLAYPTVIEPWLGLVIQGWVWTAVYAGLFVLVASCAVLLWRHYVATVPENELESETSLAADVTAGLRLKWVMLAFVPSSLLLAVTAHITTDLAAVPLLWIIPLILYLLTYVIVFSKRPVVPHSWMVRIHAYVVLVFVIVLFLGQRLPLPLSLSFHLLTFFVTAMVCHGELARRRPTTTHLTEFYLWMSVGGVLGGMFNALLAPLVFDSIVEYPIVIVLACALRPMFDGEPRGRWIRDLIYPAALGAAVYIVYRANPLGYVPVELQSVVFGLGAAVVAMIVFGFSPRPLRFALGIGVMIVSGNVLVSAAGAFNADFMRRSFFGVHRVIHEPEADVNVLMHGMTVHGAQAVDPAAWREPLGYYIEDGPIGQLFEKLNENPAPRRVAVVGLGSGGMTCYRRQQDSWVFYEIDVAVLEIARDSGFFHFLEECGGDTETVLGDARLSLVEAPDAAFDLIVIDAFSSDSIPVNLITREAVELYFSKLRADGVLVVHVSNKFLDLEPVIGNVAADLGMAARIQEFAPADDGVPASGKHKKADPAAVYRFSSTWIVLTRSDAVMHTVLKKDKRWRTLSRDERVGLWTDDYSNIVRVMRW